MMMAYSEAIRGCTSHNASHAKAAIHVLIKRLDHDVQSLLSQNLIKSYAVCISLIEKNKFGMAADLLQALRNSWREAYEQM